MESSEKLLILYLTKTPAPDFISCSEILEIFSEPENIVILNLEARVKLFWRQSVWCQLVGLLILWGCFWRAKTLKKTFSISLRTLSGADRTREGAWRSMENLCFTKLKIVFIIYDFQKKYSIKWTFLVKSVLKHEHALHNYDAYLCTLLIFWL